MDRVGKAPDADGPVGFIPVLLDGATRWQQCTACGAVVTETGARLHEQFHEAL
jgi:hypothetical protein